MIVKHGGTCGTCGEVFSIVTDGRVADIYSDQRGLEEVSLVEADVRGYLVSCPMSRAYGTLAPEDLPCPGIIEFEPDGVGVSTELTVDALEITRPS